MKEIPETINKLIIISDFDDTLANKYIFNPTNNSHKPVLNKDLTKLISKIKKLKIPFLIATSRGSDDPFLNLISKLSHFPLIVESGGALYSERRIINLLNSGQSETLDQIKHFIKPHATELKGLIRKQGFLLLVRFDRLSSIEFRIQNVNGVGVAGKDGKIYILLKRKLKVLLGKSIQKVSLKLGGSSLNIVPKGISKENALRKLFKDIGLSQKNTLTVGIGDSEQDREIYKLSDMSICVGKVKIEGTSLHLPGGAKSVVKFLKTILEKYSLTNSGQLILICRHGQTDGNKIKNKILGWSNDSLNSAGIKQAKLLAKKIKGQNVQVIFSSKTIRALQTAKIISKLTGIPVKTDERLNEYDFGVFTGKVLGRKEIYKGIDSSLKRFNFKLPRGESDKDVVQRVNSFAKELIKKKTNAVVCTHSFPAFVLNRLLLGNKVKDFVDLPFKDMGHDEIVVVQK